MDNDVEIFNAYLFENGIIQAVFSVRFSLVSLNERKIFMILSFFSADVFDIRISSSIVFTLKFVIKHRRTQTGQLNSVHHFFQQLFPLLLLFCFSRSVFYTRIFLHQLTPVDCFVMSLLLTMRHVTTFFFASLPYFCCCFFFQ